MASIKNDKTMAKQQHLGWKLSPNKNNDKGVPDFGDLLDADCSMVEVQDTLENADALFFPDEPQSNANDLPRSPGSTLALAEKDAENISTDTDTNEHPHLNYLFQDWIPTEYPFTHHPDTLREYDILHDPNDFDFNKTTPLSETLQTAPVFERIDARVTPEPGGPKTITAETETGKKPKRKGKGKKKIIVDADVEMLEKWVEDIDEKPSVDYGKMQKEQRKRFEKMGIRR